MGDFLELCFRDGVPLCRHSPHIGASRRAMLSNVDEC